MASPIVAGIAALYLQKRPTATYDEIKQALICTAVKDNFTGPTANTEYGNGKVNAFAALTRANCLVYGVKDTACINYSPTATVDTGGCQAKVYGCTDSAALNFNPLANIPDGSCNYSIGINQLSRHGAGITAVPNPFSGSTEFEVTFTNNSAGEGKISLLNSLGALVDEIPVNSKTTRYPYRNPNLKDGVYYYLLTINGKTAGGGKLIAE
jgi:hypothetical protein